MLKADESIGFRSSLTGILRQNEKKVSFAVSHPPKCIANLRIQPMHFKMNLEFIKLHLLWRKSYIDLVDWYRLLMGGKERVYKFG